MNSNSSITQIANNQDVQAKLRREIKQVYDSNGEINYEKLVDHEYLDCVSYESLRLHPSMMATSRECTEALELDGVEGKKFQIEVGEVFVIPIFSIHHDPG
jgi:cytochrome P450